MRSGVLRELRAEGAEGTAAVADPVLLLGRELRHRAIPALRHEQWVVAEAPGPPLRAQEQALADALGVDLDAAFGIQNPAGDSVGLGQAVNEGRGSTTS